MKTIIKTKHSYRAMPSLLKTCAVAMLLTLGNSLCWADSPKDIPPDDLVKGQIRSQIPHHLKVENVESESLSSSEGTIKMAFKAKLTAQEDLFVEDKLTLNDTRIPTDMPADLKAQIPPMPRCLKLTQKEAAKGNIYGTFTATRRLDQWNFGGVVIESGMEQFGKPQGSFGADFVIGGTPEAEAAKQKYADTISALKTKADQIIAQQKKESEELHRKQDEQNAAIKRQAEEAAISLKKKLLEATAPGTLYEGVVTIGDGRQGIRMQFLEQNGTMVKCEIINPGDPNVHQRFVGDISIPEAVDGPNLVLGPEVEGKLEFSSKKWSLYFTSGNISLRLQDNSWVGAGKFYAPYMGTQSDHYIFKLTRTGSSVGAPQANVDTKEPLSIGNTLTTVPASVGVGLKTIVFSRELPDKPYRPESVADFAQAWLRANEEAQNQSGKKDFFGLGPEVRNAAANFNAKFIGQPLHYSGKFLKISKFILIKRIVIQTGPQTSITVNPRVDEAINLSLLKPGDDVEIVGDYNNILHNLSDTWTLELDNGLIVSITRPKANG